MPGVPKKRRAGGRFTPPKKALGPPQSQGRERQRTGPEPSPRYTPSAPRYRVRPRWHRVAGWGGVLAGVVIAALNDLMLMGEGVTLLPGGHSELYLLLGLSAGSGATWFLGLFDRGTTIYE